MKVDTTKMPTFSKAIIGNVYPINGGYGRKAGHSMVLIAITKEDRCLFIVIDKSGSPVGVTHFGKHYIEERTPIAIVRGIDELNLKLEPLP